MKRQFEEALSPEPKKAKTGWDIDAVAEETEDDEHFQ